MNGLVLTKSLAKVLKLYITIFLSIFSLSCYADDAKRRTAVTRIINYKLVGNPNVEIITSDFKDTPQEHPFDSICIRHAINAWDGMYDFIDEFCQFVELFPLGTTNLSIERLKASGLDEYEPRLKSMRSSLNQYRTLIRKVEEYKPYKTRRLYEDYRVKNGSGEILTYRAFYYFDDNDEIERYFWFDKLRLNGAYTMVLYAIDHSFEFVERMLLGVGYTLNPKLMAYILNENEVKFDEAGLRNYSAKLRKRDKIQTIQLQSKVTQTPQIQHRQECSQQSSNGGDNSCLSGSDRYQVTKDMCGATYTKEAMKKFTKYAVSNNINMINYMLANGELFILKKDIVVTMVDKGFIISCIMLPNGRAVYTDTENLSKY